MDASNNVELLHLKCSTEVFIYPASCWWSKWVLCGPLWEDAQRLCHTLQWGGKHTNMNAHRNRRTNCFLFQVFDSTAAHTLYCCFYRISSPQKCSLSWCLLFAMNYSTSAEAQIPTRFNTELSLNSWRQLVFAFWGHATMFTCSKKLSVLFWLTMSWVKLADFSDENISAKSLRTELPGWKYEIIFCRSAATVYLGHEISINFHTPWPSAVTI